MKKTFAVILIFVLIFSFSACGKPKASPIEDFEYEFENGETIITGYIGTDLEIVIPSEIEGRPVTEIRYNFDEGKGAFAEYDMTSIIIPEGVEYINDCSFYECHMLENISLPDSFKGFYHGTDPYNGSSDTAIWTLRDTKWLSNQPDGPLYIDNIFLGIKGDALTSSSFEIKNGTTSIISNAFDDQENITEVVIPNSVKYIGDYAFRDCDLLKQITIPNGVVVGENALENIIVHGDYVVDITEG